ncbi:hypothetical protein [Chromobacterium aquaticum]|uniref:Uncharacterized protein n=1 Tax=Chromobacterium aquaticum TaxID=467180 RepID=A0ABV8ZWR7_9NEIS|nr:hypothetical protein [Chromobacterium aquaticum]MCD5364068.1 hypothetical protein [Chromobacterium aquaticum]
MFDDFDLSGVDFDSVEDPEIVLKKRQEENIEFWHLLQVERGKIKEIHAYGELAGGVKEIGDGDSIFVSAKKLGEGSWQLSRELTDNWQKAFLLNYKAAKVTCVKRSDYEANHDFFLTVALSGCRFTLTETHVLHIAADAGVGSAGRDLAESTALNVVPGRKRSVSVTSKEGSILYHPMPAAALAHIALLEALSAISGKMTAGTNAVQIAQDVADVIRPLTASQDTVTKATKKLKESITGQVTEPSSIDDICIQFADAVSKKVVSVSTMVKGAFVVGIKGSNAWHYHALVNGVWAEILLG